MCYNFITALEDAWTSFFRKGVRYGKKSQRQRMRNRHLPKKGWIVLRLQAAQTSHNYRPYALLPETGLRTAELIGLTWDSIDWEKHTLSINKSLEYRHRDGYWRAGPPKTKKSYRTIPLTDKAYDILRSCYDERTTRRESELLNQVLEYTGRRTGGRACFLMRELVFINFRTGEPIKNSSYDTHLYKLCDKASTKHFGMHTLRHTYATRAIERGVPPKVLQQLLGHARIKTTMDRYVHVTDESLSKAILLFQNPDSEHTA